MWKKLSAAALAAGLLFGAGAQAATVTYDVIGTTNKNGKQIGLWIENGLDGAGDESFAISEAGTMTVEMDGTATFLAKARDENDPTTGFDLSFELDQDFSYTDPVTGVVGPKFKSVFGGVEHGNEFYLEMKSGMMTGVGALAGLDLGVSLFPTDGEYAFQIGGGLNGNIGANQHTSDFGMSGWFQITSVESASCAGCGAIDADNSLVVGSQADVNVNLNVVVTPLPAGGMLLLTGLGLIGFMRRKS